MTEPPLPSPASAHEPAPAVPSVLRNRNFSRLWVGTVTAAGGTAVGSIVLTWIIYSTTHSALAVSLLGIVQFLPTLSFGVVAGALIDRLDRRRLMLTCDLGRCVCFGVLALYVLVVGVNLAVLLGGVFVVATFSTVFRPATNAALPRILPRAQLTDGNGLLQGGSTVAQFVGSPVGGVLVLAVGASVGLLVNALTFAVSASMIFLMVIPGAPPAAAGAPRRSLWGEVRDGLRFVRTQRALLIITFTSMAANFFLSIWGAFEVVYAGAHLHQGATGFSILVAATTAGFAVGAILPGRLGFDRAPGRWLLPTWGVGGLFVVALAAASSLGVAVALTVAGGALLSMGNTTWLSGVQRTIPDEYLGRYFATDEAGSFAMIPAGIAVGGLLVFEYGIVWAYVVAGVGALLVNLPLFLFPVVREWGRRPAAA
ncbi:MAG TPA: MFS transporter [Thermoplasmata archaeon]|nr:MFS transporter [Thermoplasmata archaeon]